MRKSPLVAGLVGGLMASAAATYAAKLPPPEVASPAIVAAARQAAAEVRQHSPEPKLADEKAVSRTDKLTVDITGTIQHRTVYSEDSCGYGAWGDVVVLFMWVEERWVSVACAGSPLRACASTRPGQRIRVRGTLFAAPDFLDPDFDACDPDTWFVGPVNFIFATKVTK